LHFREEATKVLLGTWSPLSARAGASETERAQPRGPPPSVMGKRTGDVGKGEFRADG